jgi:hypothetical protein
VEYGTAGGAQLLPDRCLPDDRGEVVEDDLARPLEVGDQRGPLDRQLVGEQQRRLVGVRRTADVLQQRGEEDVRDGALLGTGGSGQPDRDETGPRR